MKDTNRKQEERTKNDVKKINNKKKKAKYLTNDVNLKKIYSRHVK